MMSQREEKKTFPILSFHFPLSPFQLRRFLFLLDYLFFLFFFLSSMHLALDSSSNPLLLLQKHINHNVKLLAVV
ncbi:hypothetical protein R3W88_022491 [Solanum pinnatisectum]|uniref:Uncharacterized protein n=1 Tax=Solanum pinnatisectum TaxID=50273 RepID=A0AAV9LUX2_9SOLN|nr:hypothetical protein R3W88_022491 [Solanum pinnatisectum]